MDRTNVLQEIRKMRFEDTWNEWKKGCLTQEEAGRILGMSERTFVQIAQAMRTIFLAMATAVLFGVSLRFLSSRTPARVANCAPSTR